MLALEQLLLLFVAAVLLAAAARRVGAPYPVFLAVGGALLAFLPGAPSFTVPPDLALALFVAPVLLDAAYDTSLRDLRDNWAPVTGLVIFAVGLTTAAVAVVAHALVPQLPWPAAIALGAIVAPPDAVAATAILKPLRPPHRLLTILEGESLLNDASALLIYRIAVGAAAASSFSLSAIAPVFLLGVVGSVAAGLALAWLNLRLMERLQHIPTAIILQFVSTIGIWMVAEHVGLSGVLTTVCYAISLAQGAPQRIGARLRIPTNAVWETVVFALNILAFIFIGLQIRPIVENLSAAEWGPYFATAGAVVVTVIVVRIAAHVAVRAPGPVADGLGQTGDELLAVVLRAGRRVVGQARQRGAQRAVACRGDLVAHRVLVVQVERPQERLQRQSLDDQRAEYHCEGREEDQVAIRKRRWKRKRRRERDDAAHAGP